MNYEETNRPADEPVQPEPDEPVQPEPVQQSKVARKIGARAVRREVWDTTGSKVVAGTSGTRKPLSWESPSHSPPPLTVQSSSDDERPQVMDVEEDQPQQMKEMSTYVIVRYEESYFPGLVICIKKKTTTVSCMARSGGQHWKWPDVPDIFDYDPANIVEIINTPQIVNSRGLIKVPEVEKFWKILYVGIYYRFKAERHNFFQKIREFYYWISYQTCVASCHMDKRTFRPSTEKKMKK